jgi:hypothetical protein
MSYPKDISLKAGVVVWLLAVCFCGILLCISWAVKGMKDDLKRIPNTFDKVEYEINWRKL